MKEFHNYYVMLKAGQRNETVKNFFLEKAYLVCYKYLAGISDIKSVARSVVLETIEKLKETEIDTAQGPVGGYIFKMLKHKALDVRKVMAPTRDKEVNDVVMGSSNPSPLVLEDLEKQIDICLDSEIERLIWRLFFNGYSPDEIKAYVTDKFSEVIYTVGTIRVKISNIRRKLKQCFINRGFAFFKI